MDYLHYPPHIRTCLLGGGVMNPQNDAFWDDSPQDVARESVSAVKLSSRRRTTGRGQRRFLAPSIRWMQRMQRIGQPFGRVAYLAWTQRNTDQRGLGANLRPFCRPRRPAATAEQPRLPV